MPSSCKLFFPSDFKTKIYYVLPVSCLHGICSAIILALIILIGRVQIMKLIMKLSLASYHFLRLVSKYIPWHPSFKIM